MGIGIDSKLSLSTKISSLIFWLIYLHIFRSFFSVGRVLGFPFRATWCVVRRELDCKFFPFFSSTVIIQVTHAFVRLSRLVLKRKSFEIEKIGKKKKAQAFEGILLLAILMLLMFIVVHFYDIFLVFLFHLCVLRWKADSFVVCWIECSRLLLFTSKRNEYNLRGLKVFFSQHKRRSSWEWKI